MTPPHRRWFLDPPHARRTAEHEWSLSFAPHQDAYLHDHLVHDIPTLPGTFMLEIAAEAAEAVCPGLVTTGFRDADFAAFVRPFLGRTPPEIRVRAVPLAPDERVAVTLETVLSPLGPTAPVIRKRSFRTEVHLAPRDTPPTDSTPATDPYYRPGSPVHLKGIFRNTTSPGVNGRCGSARWAPQLEQAPWLREFTVPALLICSTARTAALPPDASGRQTLFVPRHIARVDLLTPGANDWDVEERHGSGVALYMDDPQTFRAVTASGAGLVHISGAQLAAMGQVDP